MLNRPIRSERWDSAKLSESDGMWNNLYDCSGGQPPVKKLIPLIRK